MVLGLLKCFQQLLGEIFHQCCSWLLQGDVKTSIGAYVLHDGFHLIAYMYKAEYFIAIDKSSIPSVNYYFVADVGRLPDLDAHFLACVVAFCLHLHISVETGSGNDATGTFVYIYVYHVGGVFHHTTTLLAEWYKEVFGKTPVEKGTIAVGPWYT